MTKKTERFDWRSFNAKLIDALDIEEVYVELGIKIKEKAQPGPTGWLSCYAIRGEQHASAAINVGLNGRRGVYTDLAQPGSAMGLKRFIQTHCSHRFANWFEAQRYLAKKVGLDKEMPENLHAGRPLEDYLTMLDPKYDELYFEISARKFIRISGYPEISPEAMRQCGGVMADLCGKQVLAFPTYGPHLFDAAPNSYVCLPIFSKTLDMGPNQDPQRKVSVGVPSGLMGTHGLRYLKDAKIVVKLEGVTDLLTAQTVLKKKTGIVAITNSGGANEVNLPAQVATLFDQKRVLVLHDGDKAGQLGAKLWLGALGKYAKTITNVELGAGLDTRAFLGSL